MNDFTPTLQDLRNGHLRGARRLDLSCGLTEFPDEIFALADTLEVLNLSGNALHTLPDDLHRLTRLRVLFCSHNRFTQVPESVGQCASLETVGFRANQIDHLPAASLPPALRALVLTDNRLTDLPAALGACEQLQKLMLTGNALRELPAEMTACHRLELLRIAANRFDGLPGWLLALPRLAWLACAGNPFNDDAQADAVKAQPLQAIGWQRLALQQVLGEGASGVIHQAVWQRTPGALAEAVAVKLFKGEVTSDGLPGSEMAACIAAQSHPGLIEVLGHVADHPEGKTGLVMRLIDPAFQNLAGPPSLDSCTRDVYASDARFTAATVRALAHGVADAARHLHAGGVTHGDLYAHNILWCEEGGVLLGDFGAASFTRQSNDGVLAQALERIEVRAFGCLLEELLARADAGVGMAAMQALRQRCVQHEVSARPLFAEIASALAG